MSSLKLLPSQLSYEELMEAMGDAEEDLDEVLEHFDDLVPFLSHYRVQPGDSLVSKRLLYKLYRTYSKNPVPRTEFIFRVGEFISSKMAGGLPFFCLNQDNFAISQHIFKQEKRIEKTKSLTYQKHFKWFLDGQKIKPGNKWLEGFILFFIYKQFCREKRIKPKLGSENFHKFLKLHFQYRRRNGNRSLHFKIDSTTHGLLAESEKEVIRDSRKKSEKAGRRSEKTESKSEESPPE
jgi:hypothetical protein